ncbi:type IV toxin-antitoxin system AbiEi family antitoxin domain-containing protein [Facklamia sp. P12945]|uniref:type IV toxin-antitoxin system AbiEi family antitoxin domain-containing protein n=1 Tax=unclassified Facklamia TaxID=2622293 RepID=UPI003D1808D1
MNYIEKIREKIKQSGGIITSKEVKNSGIPTVYLTRMVENGELTRASRGIYIDSNGDYDEYYFFHSRFSVPIFSYVSALYLHKFTDIIPNEMEITVYRGYNPHRISENVIIHYVTKDIYDLGVTECKTVFGNLVKVYDLERTLCDLIKNRNEVEAELFSKTINRYVRSQNKDLNKLYEYSKKMKIYEQVKELMEVIYE